MPRATRVLRAAERRDTSAVDTLILPHAQRQAQKGFLFGVKGICVELDFAEPVRLRTDDALVLDDGGLVEIVAEPEPLIEARAADLPALARLAWHLGDRHVPVQVLERRLGSSPIRRSRRCCKASAPRWSPSMRRSSRRAAPTTRRWAITVTTTITMIMAMIITIMAMRTVMTTGTITIMPTTTIITTMVTTNTTISTTEG